VCNWRRRAVQLSVWSPDLVHSWNVGRCPSMTMCSNVSLMLVAVLRGAGGV
jgi:hypothetical protein